MSWFKVRDGKVVYAGAISRAPYVAWSATKAGSQAIDAAASQAGFRLFGPARARRRVWREIRDAARSENGSAALQAAADLYLLTMSNLAYASGLPRTTVGLRRLVLVPRTLASGRARPLIAARLAECQAFAERPLAERDFLFEAVLSQADAAVRGASPSVRHPIRAADGGSADLSNCLAVCLKCHKWKTRTFDIPQVAKGKRVRDQHQGIKRPIRSFPTNRDGPFKKRLDGIVERR